VVISGKAKKKLLLVLVANVMIGIKKEVKKMEYLANSGNISEELFFDVIKLLPKDRPGKYWITWNFLGIKKMM